MKKRIFAILLALVMLLGALPVTAMAADNVSRVVKSAFTTWDTYERALVLTRNVAEPVYATVVVKPGETITDFGNLVFFTTGGHALSSGFSNTLRWNYTPDVVDLNVVEDGGTLRVSFTGKQEGTAKVKLNYWTSYYFPDTQTGSGVTAHCSGDIYYNLIVSNDPVDLNTKPEKPGKDVLDTLVGDTTNVGVYLRCDDSDNYNNNNKHDQPFSTIAFTEDSCLVSDVFANDGTYDISDIRTYPWMCKVTVYGQPFVDYYNNVLKGKDKGNHYLLNPTSRYFYLYYNVTTGEWDWVADLPPIFGITKTEKNMQDITLAYDGGDHAADKVTGIPASETKRVNTGAKAKFTVSSDVPTCGCGKNCTFLGWKLDGDSKLYTADDAIELDESATLHAQWREGSGGDDNEPTNPPSSGENGDIEKALYGKNVTVRCVNNENAHEEKPYDAKLGLTSASPVKIDAGLPLGETTYKTAYEIKLSADKFVELYSGATPNGSGEAHHRKDGTAAELTWIIYWDASLLTDNKWAAYENDQKIVEAEHTVTEPTTPPSTEELRPLLGKVEVDCVDRTVKHDTLEYDAVDGLVEGSLQKVAGGYQTGSGQHYDTAYTCTLSGAKFAQLYSGKTTDTPAGSGVAHTLKTPETIACTVYWNPVEGKWVATKETSVIQTTHAEYTVTFKYQVNGYSDKTQTVVAGSTVTKPADERREGYTLEGWYETADCTGEKFNFSTPINANKILYAKWTAKQVPYTIRHRDKDTNETVAPDTTGTGAYGEKITLTPKTDIADYVPAEGNPQYSWLMSEVGNIFTLRYVKLFTVSFDCHMDGMTIAAKTVQRNAKVTSPGTLTRTGYAFGGWYKNLSDAAAYDFDTPVTESFTLHAKWTPRTDIPYTVKYLEEGTNRELHAAKTGTGTFNTTVQVTAEAISGYTLVGSSPRDLKLENVSSNELIFYYTKDPVKVSYTVHYYLDGTTTKVAADKVVNNVNAGTEVTEDAISVTGYTAAAPTQQKLNLSATGTNEIIFYYTKNVGTQVAYTIRYLKESTGEALLPAYSGTGVVGNSLTVTAPAIDGYTALAPTSYTITLNAEAAKNIITFYYREATSTIPAGEPAKEPFNKNANPRQLNRDDHFAYIKGYPDGTVRPEASLTRAEAAAILYRVMEKSCVERFHAESSSFRDVPDGKWYTTYVATLEKAGVIVDSKDGNFRPNDAITRAELASMLAQFANVTGGTTSFSDVPATHWAADYIAAAVRSGWIQGYPDGTFRPEQTIKRAEMTAMVNRALGRDPQSASDLLEGMKTWKDNADPTAWFYLDIQEAANGHTYARKTGGEYWTGLVADVVQ